MRINMKNKAKIWVLVAIRALGVWGVLHSEFTTQDLYATARRCLDDVESSVLIRVCNDLPDSVSAQSSVLFMSIVMILLATHYIEKIKRNGSTDDA